MKNMTLYDFEQEFTELMNKALNDLSPQQFKIFLDDLSIIISDYEE